jgi:tetratricopeptide (TPR) repeat protein
MKRAAALLLAASLASFGVCQPATTASKSAIVTTPSTPVRAVIQPTAGAAWFENDAERAFAAARDREQLLFVDLWAPWCHTCLSMQAQVLHARWVPELMDVVVLVLDTERPENEQFLRSYPVGVWPTFYVIDPQSRQVHGRWLGGATAAQLSRFLRDASAGSDAPSTLLREGDALAAAKSFADAEKRYRAALAAAPPDWPRRADALVALLSSLRQQRRFGDCLSLALAEAAQLPPSVSSVDFAGNAASCASKAPGDVNAAAVLAVLARTLERDCASPAPGASVDDHADACGNLRGVLEALGDRAGARRASERALSVIEAGSAGAGPEVQAIYDWERTQSLVFLGRTAEAIELLQERERALPSSYNPPHYLARLFRDTAQWQLGLAAIERALAKAYGPRRIGFLGIKADLLVGAGRADEARTILQQQLDAYRALPPGQRLPDAEASVQKKLAELAASPSQRAHERLDAPPRR